MCLIYAMMPVSKNGMKNRNPSIFGSNHCR